MYPITVPLIVTLKVRHSQYYLIVGHQYMSTLYLGTSIEV